LSFSHSSFSYEGTGTADLPQAQPRSGPERRKGGVNQSAAQRKSKFFPESAELIRQRNSMERSVEFVTWRP
jgi:hypothetical protein